MININVVRKALEETLENLSMMNLSDVHLHSPPEDALVKSLCEKIGYGAVMDSAARLWYKKDPFGAYVIGGCAGILRNNKELVEKAIATLNDND